MKIAYSYIRFSTGKQADGDSLERQTRLTAEWCHRNGYTLDKQVRKDLGRSSYRGSNLRRGALGDFLRLVQAGVIRPGAALVIESLDRASRQAIDKSIDLTRQILEAGVDIVTLIPERHYTKASLQDGMVWMELVFTYQRANEESKTKGERLKQRWLRRREAIKAGKPVSRRLPFWISLDGDLVTGKFVLNKKVSILEFVFRRYSEGAGLTTIISEMHARGYSISQRKKKAVAIRPQVLSQLLRDRKVLGEFQPCLSPGDGSHPQIGETVPNYFPPAIPVKLFQDVQARLGAIKRTSKGRRGRGGTTSVFGGLLVDSRDNTKMYPVNKSGKHYLVSLGSLQGNGGRYCGLDLETFQRQLLRVTQELDANLLRQTEEVDLVSGLEAQLADKLAQIARQKARVDRAKTDTEEEVAHERLVELTDQRHAIEAELDKAKAETSADPAGQLVKLQSLLAVLEQAEDKDKARMLVKGLIAALVRAVYVHPQARGKYARRALVQVEFHTGMTRRYLMEWSPVGQFNKTTCQVVTWPATETTNKLAILPSKNGWA